MSLPGPTLINSDVYIAGNLAAQTFTPPAGSVADAAVSASAAIQATKLQQQHEPVCVMSDNATAAAVLRKVIHRVKGATGILVEFGVGATVATGAASSITVDLKKNGTTVLTASITLDNGTAAYTLKAAAGYTSTALVTGDVLEAHITAVAGANLPKGVYCQVTVREDAQ